MNVNKVLMKRTLSIPLRRKTASLGLQQQRSQGIDTDLAGNEFNRLPPLAMPTGHQAADYAHNVTGDGPGETPEVVHTTLQNSHCHY